MDRHYAIYEVTFGTSGKNRIKGQRMLYIVPTRDGAREFALNYVRNQKKTWFADRFLVITPNTPTPPRIPDSSCITRTSDHTESMETPFECGYITFVEPANKD